MLTLLGAGLCFIYLTSMLVDMNNNNKDQLEVINILNNFEKPFHEVHINKM
jgi:hypothetical protein